MYLRSYKGLRFKETCKDMNMPYTFLVSHRTERNNLANYLQ